MKSLGNRLLATRKRFGYTQKQIAKFQLIPRPGYTQLEKGNRQLSASEAILLSELYKCTIDELIKGKAKIISKAKINQVVELAWSLRQSNKFYFKSYVSDAIQSLNQCK